MLRIVVSCRRFGTTYRSYHQRSGNVSGILLGLLDPGRWEPKFVSKRWKLNIKVRCVHIPRERRFHSHRGGNPQPRSNIFVDMKNNKTAFNLGNRRCQTNWDWWTVSNNSTSQASRFGCRLSQEISIGKTTEHGISIYSTVK